MLAFFRLLASDLRALLFGSWASDPAGYGEETLSRFSVCCACDRLIPDSDPILREGQETLCLPCARVSDERGRKRP